MLRYVVRWYAKSVGFMVLRPPVSHARSYDLERHECQGRHRRSGEHIGWWPQRMRAPKKWIELAVRNIRQRPCQLRVSAHGLHRYGEDHAGADRIPCLHVKCRFPKEFHGIFCTQYRQQRVAGPLS